MSPSSSAFPGRKRFRNRDGRLAMATGRQRVKSTSSSLSVSAISTNALNEKELEGIGLPSQTCYLASHHSACS